jgi:amino acid adenylation domain-containing protein/non-ribosomal peptide synthase protein (TIGR01720 family)
MNEAGLNLLLTTNKFRRQREFWTDILSGELNTARFFGNGPARLKEDGREGEPGRHEIGIAEAVCGKLLKISKNSDVSLYILLLTAVKILIYKYTGEEDIAVLSPVNIHTATAETFNRTIVIRDCLNGELTFKESLLKVRQSTLEAYENQDYPLTRIVAQIGLPQTAGRFRVANISCSLGNIHGEDDGELDSAIAFRFVRIGERIAGTILFNRTFLSEQAVRSIAVHLTNILNDVLEDVNVKISAIEMLSPAELGFWLREFNRADVPYPKHLTITRLFEEQAGAAPDHIAVVCGDLEITYRELNERTGRLARRLNEKGVSRGDVVGIFGDNSIEIVIAMLAVLKSGAAYLPIDSDYPLDRIEYLLEDSRVKMLLVQETPPEGLKLRCEWMDVGRKEIYEQGGLAVENPSHPQDIAYIIYTSGTTGRPKGAQITHQGLVNYIWWAKKVYVGDERLDFPLYSSISFDLTVTSIYTPLITGNKIVIYRGDDKFDRIKKAISENKVGIMKLTPTHLKILAELDCSASGIRKLIVGGENLRADLARKISAQFGDQIEIYNEYGPTETVVGCMIYRFDPAKDPAGSVPIGTPADNVRIYILDRYQKPVPRGAVGEIHISGDGVAKGYINKPELTSEKFIPNPFIPGKMMYKSGDLAKMLPDGNLEYIGRIDNQVKIRGYRIEPGEIESCLLQMASVRQAVVIGGEDGDGNKDLCAYVVAANHTGIGDIRDYLGAVLPEYMIPSRFYRIDRIPVNINGKVDREALLEIQDRMGMDDEYAAPRNEAEEKLAEIWSQVLAIEKVGIHDSFFALGGDSIKAIQVSARMQKFQMKVRLHDILQHPTIGELSAYVQTNRRETDQGPVSGKVELSPAQKWFFQRKLPDRHHYNQAVMLRGNSFDGAIVKRVFAKLMEHHDALRMVYRIKGDQVLQICRGWEDGPFDLDIIDLRGMPSGIDVIPAKATDLQGSMNLEKGALVKLGLFLTDQGDHLLIAIHHLVVDSVSWRIILEDFYQGYRQAVHHEAITFQPKTDSFQAWTEQLNLYADSAELLSEIEYWNGFKDYDPRLFSKENIREDCKRKGRRTFTVSLNQKYTEMLLKETHKAFNTEISDLLLTALGLSVKEITRKDKIIVALEGHGREELFKNIDISRTVGWFTSIYPVMLDLSQSDDLSYLIRYIKEGLRRVPNKGVGFGILKYMTDSTDKEPDAFNIRPEISFNYHGQVEGDLQNELFRESNLAAGMMTGIHSECEYPLDINGRVTDRQLTLKLYYDGSIYSESTAGRLMGSLIMHLQRIIDFCATHQEITPTPSDLGDPNISLEELEKITELIEKL